MRFYLFLALLTGSMASFAQSKFLFVGTYTKGSSEGIYVYSFNEKTGDLHKLSSERAENPSYLALSPNQKFLYAVSENGGGSAAVNAYSFDKKVGKLKLISTQSANGEAPCYVAIDKTGKWAVTANYGGGNFCVYPVRGDGTIGKAVQNIHHEGSSVNKDRQEKPHVHSSVFSPDQKYLAVADLGIDKIMIYPFDASKPKPVSDKVIEVKSKPGAGPRHIIFHPSRPFFYVIEELSGFVTAYRFENGRCTELQSVNAHPEDFKGDIGSAAIKISPDGKYLYASNRGASNTIASFLINGKDGKLELKKIEGTEGVGPRDFSIAPSGKFLLAANAKSGSVVEFRRDVLTGLFGEKLHTLEVPDPVCLLFSK